MEMLMSVDGMRVVRCCRFAFLLWWHMVATLSTSTFNRAIVHLGSVCRMMLCHPGGFLSSWLSLVVGFPEYFFDS